MRRCHIFAGGDLGSKPTKEYFRSRQGFVICADSGYKHAKKLGLRPDIIVGDFDSYKGRLPENTEIIRTVPEKDDTDALMALKIAIERGYRAIWLYGALGGERFDHSIANLQLMLYAREQGARLMICGNEWVTLQGSDEVERSALYPKKYGDRYFSVFAVTETVKIRRLSGVKYPLENYEMKRSFPIGVSNEITGESAVLDIESGLALVVQS
ncbi:MAG: thiamine diphosphokinase [Ruminococcus sp.]|nr:thiamine diphosphokinase [Ruminococcus sp.]